MGEQMRLQGKTALVTGGASGFGAGIAKKFAAEGARVMVADLNLAEAKTIAAKIGGAAQLCDVSHADSVEEMKVEALKTFGSLDILVNNAGATHLPMALEDVGL